MQLYLDQIDSKLSADAVDIGGTIYLQIGNTYFPEENWYDYASLILKNWIPALLSFAHRSADTCKLTFWDGPCYLKLYRNLDTSVSAECYYDKKMVVSEAEIDLSAFLRSVLKAGNRFCRFLHLRGRTCADVSASLELLKRELRTVEDAGPYKSF